MALILVLVLVLFGVAALIWVLRGVGNDPQLVKWKLDRKDSEGRTLQIHFDGGLCDEDVEAVVDETETEVRIVVVITRQVRDCSDVAVRKFFDGSP